MTYPNEVVERVAEAINDADPDVPVGWHKVSDLYKGMYRDMARAALDAAEVGALVEALRECREACLFVDDDGTVRVTEDPHVPNGLFGRMCIALAAWEPKP